MKRVNISVINDLVTDQRLHRIAFTLRSMGMDVHVVGRKLPGSLEPDSGDFGCHRFRMLFKKGPLFYMFFNLRLGFYLLFRKKPDVYVAFDLDTLLANYVLSKVKRVPLLYDSHEYFTEVPELQGRRFVQGVWTRLEEKIVPKLKYAMTVSGSIAEIYTEKYGLEFLTVRNLPRRVAPKDTRKGLELEHDSQKVIYQGALNVGRGLELLIDAMQYMSKVQLLIAGSGDEEDALRKQSAELLLGDRVTFLGKLKPVDLKEITAACALGVSLEEDMGLNYRYALPNKIFDYIQAGIPVLCSDLPEMAKVVRKYEVGEVCDGREAKVLAAQVMRMLESGTLRQHWGTKLEDAAQLLVWEKEEEKLKGLIERIIGA